MNRATKDRSISVALTLFAGAAAVALLLMFSLEYRGPKKKKWPPEDTSELLLAGEYVAVGDIPEPQRDSRHPAPAEQSSEAKEAVDVTDEGAPSPEPQTPLASKAESPVKVKEKPKPEKTGPTKEEIAEREKAKREKEAAERVASRVKFGQSTTSGSGSGSSGSPDGNAATGSLSGQPGVNLKGRTIQSWTSPRATATGSIKVKVRVNRLGRVISADYHNGIGPVASIAAARANCVKAALASSFSVDNDAPAEQTGYITYTFK